MSNMQDQFEYNQQIIKVAESIERLSANPDFRKVILESYMIQECARYVHASGDPALGLDERADALNMAQAAGHLARFLEVAKMKATVAARDNAEITSLENEVIPTTSSAE